MNEEYKYRFFKNEIDNLMNNKLVFKEKQIKFFDIIKILVFDALSLLSEINYFYKNKEDYSKIYLEIISKFYYKNYVFGGEFFDEKHNESNKNLSKFLKEMNEKENKLFVKFNEFLYVFEQDFRIWVLYWFDFDSDNFERSCKEMLIKKNIKDNPYVWLSTEVIRVQEKFLQIIMELRKLRKNNLSNY